MKSLTWILILLFLSSVPGNEYSQPDIFEEDMEEIQMDDMQKSYAEIAEILKELGIGGITDELITELENAYALMPPEILINKTATTLTYIGAGQIDYDTWEWVPDKNGVYTFDVEVFNLEKIYTFFLQGVSALGDGELNFTNIQEDLSDVNWENGTGTRSVTFDWNGETYTLEAENMGDWFDLSVADQLNQIIISKGGEKRLYFTSDGYQECIIFYRDEAWAKSFEEKTGLELSDEAQ